jgi:ATP-dependent Clp protease ATP-binding subunit ClpA
VGAEALRKGPLGIPGTHKMSEFREGGFETELKRLFRPEFLNRIDQIIVFKTLSMEQTQEIVDLELAKIEKRLVDQGISLEATPEAKSHLAHAGYSEEFGARNLRRAVQQAIEDELSEGILSGEFSEGAHIVIRLQDDEIVLEARYPEIEPPLLEAMVNV